MNDTSERLRSVGSLRRVRDGLDPEQVADLLAAQGREIQQLRRALDDALDDAQHARNALQSERARQHVTPGQPSPNPPSQITPRAAAQGHHHPYPGGR